MTDRIAIKRLGFFTRLLDETTAAERYRLALAQIQQAERCGYDSAWIAQHHFHEGEGGLPAPFVFLAQAAARTERLRLGTGIVTLPLELPLRVAACARNTKGAGKPPSPSWKWCWAIQAESYPQRSACWICASARR